MANGSSSACTRWMIRAIRTPFHRPALTALTSYIKSKQDAGAIQAVTVRDGLALYGGTIPGPVISNVSAAPGSTQAVITWTTSGLSSTIVDYGLTPSFSNTTPETNIAPGVTSHSVTITGLKSCTTYPYRVRSRDGSSNEGHKIGQAFTTTGCDGIAPVISNVSAVPGDHQAEITWTTNEAATSRVRYGLTTAYGNLSPETDTVPRVTAHGVTIDDLSECTTYHYRVLSNDAGMAGSTSADATLTTGCDVTPPVISSVSAVPGDHQAEIAWTTNEDASSRVEYGLTASYGSSSLETDIDPGVTDHWVAINGLVPCTTYHYRVFSNDAALNEGGSTDRTLKTTGCDVTPPAISSVSAVPGDHQAEITWTTNEAASTRVEYGLTLAYGSSSGELNVSPRVSDHWAAINGLAICTTYHYRVFSKDAALNEGGSADATFKTTGCDVTPPAISNVSAVPGENQAEITWTTDEAASTRVEYGLTDAYGTTTTEENVAPGVTSHSMLLSNLDNCTIFHYRVHSKDASENDGISPDKTFMTTNCDETPPVISNVVVTATTTQILVSWITDENASAYVEYGLTPAYGTSTPWTGGAMGVTNHLVTLPGTTACTPYHYRIHAKDIRQNEAISGETSLTTTCYKAFIGFLSR